MTNDTAALREARAEEFRVASEPILRDLRDVGMDPPALWSSTPFGIEQLEVIFAHLERGGYCERVMERLGRRMGDPSGRVFWPRLVALLRSARSAGEATGVSAALSDLARAEDVPELIALLDDVSIGDARTFLVHPILQFGGVAGESRIEELRNDERLSAYAAWALNEWGGKRQKRYATARAKFDTLAAETARPDLNADAEEWSASFDLADWKVFATHLRKNLGGELAQPLGTSFRALIASAPGGTEDSIVIATELGAVRIDWFIDDVGTVDAALWGSAGVVEVCETWYAAHIDV